MSIKDQIIWGGLYRVKNKWNADRLNDKHYNQAVPVLGDNDEIYMVDTYHLDYPSQLNGQSKTDAAIEKIINFGKSPHPWVITKTKCDYYYSNYCQISFEGQLSNFELICDLHDFRGLDKYEDKRNYSSDDLVEHVKLYHEHGYSWDYGSIGVTLVRKGAAPVAELKIQAALKDFKKSFTLPHPGYYFRKDLDSMMEQYTKTSNPDPEIIHKYSTLVEEWELLKELREQVIDFESEHAYIPEYNFITMCKELKDAHSDIERYLAEDCYCPGEIYDPKGFSYMIFTTESPYYELGRDGVNILGISKSSNIKTGNLMPQFLSIELNADDHTKILDIMRLDINEHNWSELKKLIDPNIIKPIMAKYEENNQVTHTRLNEIINKIIEEQNS